MDFLENELFMLNSYIGYNLHCFLFLEFLLVQIFLFLVYQIFSRFRLFYYICVKICFGLHDSVFNLSKFVLISMFLFLIRQNLFWSPCFCFWFVKFVLVLILFTPGVSSCVICSKCPLTPSLGAKYAAFDL